ncbi:hypothetical protein OS493_029594 [Desmophyllum pertusum]|uniref:Uncharacterized protein n=1 Tax=Desmophyllum pertusum TaxID=174260 RepID=A0A9X0D7T7_9CNID|nr:hypothetical protein OS493_029594 [Desmophyllum pertusum]
MEKANPFPSETVDAFRNSSETVPTLRFKLSLTDSDDKKCPEFSFLELVKNASASANDTPEKIPWEEDGEDENLELWPRSLRRNTRPDRRNGDGIEWRSYNT